MKCDEAKALAKSLGHLTYFSGKPCIRGHVAERRVLNGRCLECEKDDTREFKKLNHDQIRQRENARYKADPEKFRQRANAARAANVEKHRKRELELYYLNVEKNRKNSRNYQKKVRAENPEKYREQDRLAAQKRRASGAERERLKKWAEANPEQFRAGKRNYDARKKNAEGFHTGNDIQQIRDRQKDRCVYCSKPLFGKGHVDHIIPLKRHGTNWPDNLQLTCVSCNTSKRDSDMPKTIKSSTEFDIRPPNTGS